MEDLRTLENLPVCSCGAVAHILTECADLCGIRWNLGLQETLEHILADDATTADLVIRFMRESGLFQEGENVRPHYEAEDKHSHNHAHSEGVPCCLEELKHDEIVEMNPSESESYTVIIREHENAHHGHSHTHGHVHSPPKTMSSVAWMVVMGDGLHNFTDGMAIGAAFAANVAGGFSTAIAVFCHELPHEIGDFAVLLKAGMSLKRAVFYNLLSSALCLFGMLLGVALGNSATTTPWVFAAAGGLFLYIALVDMIPELTSSHSKEGGSVCQCLLQFLGLITGTGIMLAIAIYEHDLKTVFTDGD